MTAIRAAGGATTVTVTAIGALGRAPGTSASTVTTVRPGYPPRSSPVVVSIFISKEENPGDHMKRTPGTGRPWASNASARSWSESPTTTVGSTGMIAMRATGLGGRP